MTAGSRADIVRRPATERAWAAGPGPGVDRRPIYPKRSEAFRCVRKLICLVS